MSFKTTAGRSVSKLFKTFSRSDAATMRGKQHFTRDGKVAEVDEWLDSSFDSSVTYTTTTTSAGGTRTKTLIEVICVGGGGGGTPGGNGGGGQGGFVMARFSIPTAEDLVFAVGKKGLYAPGPAAGGAGATPTILAGGSGYSNYDGSGTYGGGGGGGGTGVFATPSAPGVTQGNALIIAGGGGGNRFAGGLGGNGGGPAGDSAPNPGTGTAGGGGTALGGGGAGYNQPGSAPATAGAGTALNGGANASVTLGPSWAYGGGGGGAGYFGGGGGGGSNSTSGANSAGGGGGSGYINTTSPFYSDPQSGSNRNYTGMGWPGSYGTGTSPAPLGYGKDHPQISPLGAVGRGDSDGVLIINYYNPG